MARVTGDGETQHGPREAYSQSRIGRIGGLAALPILFALLFRWAGSGLPPSQIIISAIIALLVGGVARLVGGQWRLVGLIVLITFIGDRAIGHGAYMDLGHYQTTPAEDPGSAEQYWGYDEAGHLRRFDPYTEADWTALRREESWIAIWLRRVFPRGALFGSRAAYDTLALSFTDLPMAVPMAFGFAMIAPWMAWPILIAAFLKPLGYWLGYGVLELTWRSNFAPFFWEDPRDPGELVNGLLYGIAFVVILAGSRRRADRRY